MPWNSGVYTRGYPSWTNDANSNLPISATKFDTEDNDFAAGLNNCLTIDGLNKPTSTLNWVTTLALTRTDGNPILSLGHTGGTNNPSLAFAAVDSTGSITATVTGTNPNLEFASPTNFQGAVDMTVVAAHTSMGLDSALPAASWVDLAQSANARVWEAVTSGGSWILEARNDALSTASIALQVNRSGAAVTNLLFGNATDNPSTSFLGTGGVTVTASSAGFMTLKGGAAGASNIAYLQFVDSGNTRTGYIGDTSNGDSDIVLESDAGNIYFVPASGKQIFGTGLTAGSRIDMTPDSGSFTGTLTGFTGSVTGTCQWRRIGNLVFLLIPAMSGTSNTTAMTMTGVPVAIQPSTAQLMASGGIGTNASGNVAPISASLSGGTVTFYNSGSATNFAATGTKGLPFNSVFTYLLS
jgi:hypothetical protein